jgi:hypothetical protein
LPAPLADHAVDFVAWLKNLLRLRIHTCFSGLLCCLTRFTRAGSCRAARCLLTICGHAVFNSLTVTGLHYDSLSALLCISGNSSSTFQGGSISGNSAGMHGALYLDKYANVTLDGVNCSNNAATSARLSAGGEALFCAGTCWHCCTKRVRHTPL